MFHDILFFLLGLALIVAVGNYLTDGTPVSRRQLVNAIVSVASSLAALVIGAFAVWIFGALTGPKVISRKEGVVLIILYAIYATKLILDVIHH